MVQKRYAYLMGANGPTHKFLDSLKYAENDAKRLAEAFRSHPCVFTKAEHMIASEPFVSLKGLQLLSNECTSSDLLVVHFAGHAVYDENLYLICNETNIDLLIASAINVDSIKAILRNCQARHKLLILDCCHASAAHSGAYRGQAVAPKS